MDFLPLLCYRMLSQSLELGSFDVIPPAGRTGGRSGSPSLRIEHSGCVPIEIDPPDDAPGPTANPAGRASAESKLAACSS